VAPALVVAVALNAAVSEAALEAVEVVGFIGIGGVVADLEEDLWLIE
jgi:hypothetical protein